MLQLSDKPDIQAIATETCTSPGYVRNIASSLNRKHQRRNATQMAADFASNRAVPKTISSSFSKALVRQCTLAVLTDPFASKSLVDDTVDLLKDQLDARSVSENASPTQTQFMKCQLLQALAAQAARTRALGNPLEALEALRGSLETYEGCVFCRADLALREAVALRDLSRFSEALERVDSAKAIYDNGQPGHDFFGFPVGSCALVEAWIYIYKGNVQQGLLVARKASLTIPPENALAPRLHYAHAYALFQRGKSADLSFALELTKEQLRACGAKPSVGRATLHWFLAELLRLLGKGDDARKHFDNSLEDCRELHIEFGTPAAVLGKATIDRDPVEFREAIWDLREFDEETCKKAWPNWLEPVVDAFVKARRLALVDFDEALAVLRDEGKVNRFMPALKFL